MVFGLFSLGLGLGLETSSLGEMSLESRCESYTQYTCCSNFFHVVLTTIAAMPF